MYDVRFVHNILCGRVDSAYLLVGPLHACATAYNQGRTNTADPHTHRTRGQQGHDQERTVQTGRTVSAFNERVDRFKAADPFCVKVWLHYAYKVRNLGRFVRDCVFV